MIKKLAVSLSSPIRLFLGMPIRNVIKSFYHQEKTFKHDENPDLRARLLNGLHQVLVGNLPSQFKVHGNEVNFSSNGSIMSVQAYYVGEIEYHLMTYLLSNHLKKDMVFLDIGGHHGAFTSIIGYELKKRNLGGKIFTFEPDKRNIQFIEQNLASNQLNDGRVEVIKKAVSDKNGRGRFITSSDNSCNWLEIGIETAEELNSTEMVEMTSVDAFCKDFGRVDLIKIDIQGGEYPALLGARETLLKFKPAISVEITEYAKDSQIVKTYLKELGYTLFYLSKNSKLVSADSPDKFISWDVIAIAEK
jgi:FkbM family methyltransferase